MATQELIEAKVYNRHLSGEKMGTVIFDHSGLCSTNENFVIVILVKSACWHRGSTCPGC